MKKEDKCYAKNRKEKEFRTLGVRGKKFTILTWVVELASLKR